MKGNLKRHMTFWSAMIFAAASVSCSRKSDEAGGSQPEKIALSAVTQTMYKEERIRLPEDFGTAVKTGWNSEAGELMLIYQGEGGEVKLSKLDADFNMGEATVLIKDENLHTACAYIKPDGTILLLTLSVEYDKPEIIDFDDYAENSVKTFEVRSYTSAGELTDTITIEGMDEYYSLQSSHVDQFITYGEDGYMLDFFDGWVHIGADGSIIEAVEDDGDLLFFGNDTAGNTICTGINDYGWMDGTTLTLPIEKTAFEEYSTCFTAPFPGSEGYIAYFRFSTHLSGLTEDGEMVKILDFSDSNIISSEIYHISPAGKGKFLMLGSDNDGQYMSKLTVRPDDYVEDKKTVVIASNSVDDGFRDDVTKFTRFNDEYKGEVRAYDFNDNDSLVQDILSGDAPDVYAYSEIGYMHDLTNMGALADMNELSAQYGGFSKDDILDNVIEAMEYKGGLYGIIPNFYLECFYANREVVGEEYTFWNYDEFFSIAENMPEDMVLGNYWGFQTREEVFTFMCRNSLNSWIDYENASCHFDSDEFIRVLEFCRDVNILGERPEYLTEEDRTIADTEDMLRVKNKQALMMPLMSVSCPSDIVRFAAATGLGQDGVTLLAPPSEDESGMLGVWGGELYSVINSGNCTEGGWAFVNYIMSYDRQIKQHNFCTRKDAFEDHIKADQEQMEGAWNGEVSAGFGNYSVTYDPTVSDEMLDYVRDYVSKCTIAKTMDTAVNEILDEEFDSFINGNTTAQECAEMMQNRVTIYLSEHS